MISTMIAVVTVSLRVGQTTLAVSARTCRMNSPGDTFATSSAPLSDRKTLREPVLGSGACRHLAAAGRVFKGWPSSDGLQGNGLQGNGLQGNGLRSHRAVAT